MKEITVNGNRYEIVNDNFNHVMVVKRENGKFGIIEIFDDGEMAEPGINFRDQTRAEVIAEDMSKQNDRIGVPR